MSGVENRKVPLGTVLKAARWLLDEPSVDERRLLDLMRLTGLMLNSPTEVSWRFNDRQLNTLVEQQYRRGCAITDAAILTGIGEIVVRCHADEEAILQKIGRITARQVGGFGRTRLCKELLENAALPKTRSSESSNPLTATHSITVLDWRTSKDAFDLIKQAATIGVKVDYGVRFLVRMALWIEPSSLKALTKQAEEHSLVPSIAIAVSNSCLESERFAIQAIKSRVPFFIALGAAALERHFAGGNEFSPYELDQLLEGASVQKLGRQRILARVLKESVHQWHRNNHRSEELRGRLQFVQQSPERAVGRARSPEDEIAHLQRQIEELEKRRLTDNAKLNDALAIAGKLNDDPDNSWSIFEPALVDTPEIRFRFAMAHPSQGSRLAALAKAIATFEELCCLKKPELAILTGFDRVRADRDLPYWAARTQVEIAQNPEQDAGHEASKRVFRAEKQVRAFTLEPFAGQRFGSRFQSALDRWVLILSFAFYCVALTNKGKSDRTFNELLDSAEKLAPLMGRYGEYNSASQALFRLISDSLASLSADTFMARLERFDDNPIIYAQAIWSRPTLLHDHPEAAPRLLERVLFWREPTEGQQVQRLLDLSDRCAEFIIRTGRCDLVYLLEAPFEKLHNQSPAHAFGSVSVDCLKRAVQQDEDAIEELSSNTVWASSRAVAALSES